MKPQETIDNPEIQNQSPPVKSIILWWEKKRLYYNLLMLAVIGFTAYDLSPLVALQGVELVAGIAFYFLIGANLFYTLGWVSGLLLHFIFNYDDWRQLRRWSLFVLGTLFSIAWMFLIFSEAIQFGFIW